MRFLLVGIQDAYTKEWLSLHRIWTHRRKFNDATRDFYLTEVLCPSDYLGSSYCTYVSNRSQWDTPKTALFFGDGRQIALELGSQIRWESGVERGFFFVLFGQENSKNLAWDDSEYLLNKAMELISHPASFLAGLSILAGLACFLWRDTSRFGISNLPQDDGCSGMVRIFCRVYYHFVLTSIHSELFTWFPFLLVVKVIVRYEAILMFSGLLESLIGEIEVNSLK